MKIKDIIKVTGGELICGDENAECIDFSKDSRDIKKGDVYVALKGENFDGNNFYEKAMENGASTCIISCNPTKKAGNLIKVNDTLKALQQIAKYKRSLYNIPVVAVTGSVGKTSTKDLIAKVMSKKFNVLKTQGNYNNDIGLPLTILRLKNEEALVVEMGMNHLGEISKLTDIAKPTLAVITNIGTAHIGNLGSRENILKAKLEILEGLQGNTVIINNDNDLLSEWAAKENNYKVITYGIDNKNSQYVAENVEGYEDKSIFKLAGTDYKVMVPVAGSHFVLNSLCAISVGRFFDISMKDIIEGISELELTQKRMEIQKNSIGAIIINDTYNANYDSMKAAINYLQGIKSRRKIAVLGDMLELGNYSEKLHKAVGDEIKNIDVLITIGEQANYIADNATSKEVYRCKNNEDAIKILIKIIKPNDAILVKASNSMKFEEIAEKIKNI